VTTREAQELRDELAAERSRIDGLENLLAELTQGGRVIAVSEGPATEAARELHGSAAWPSKPGPILAKHTSTCHGCNGKIWKDDPIIEVDPDSDSHLAGDWVHEECAPDPEARAAA
jgi:hypothetical protein